MITHKAKASLAAALLTLAALPVQAQDWTGAYVGVGDYSLYMKYDLSETFKNDALKQNNISLGVRMDFD